MKREIYSFLIIIILISGVYAASSLTSDYYSSYSTNSYSSSTNYYQTTTPTTSSYSYSSSLSSAYWPTLSGTNYQNCEGSTTDFIVAIPPAGCTPNVVRSDLLAEQNVPVFCKISALKINPLIDVSAIQSMSFSGEYSEGVSGVSYHPSREAVSTSNTLLGSPYVDNAGYVVITLSRQADERDLPEFVEGNLTARIRYDAQHLFGTGLNEYYLEAGEEEEAFWNGKGFIDVEAIDNGQARINIYTRRNANPYKTITLSEGESSGIIYYPGYYCSLGFAVKLNKIVAPENMALLNIEGDKIWVRQGSRFLDNKCYVKNLNVFSGNTGTVDINCAGSTFQLKLNSRGVLLSSGDSSRDYSIGEEIIASSGTKYHVAYYGRDSEGKNFVILSKKDLDDSTLSYINNHFSSRDFSGYTAYEFQSSLSSTKEGKQKVGELNEDYFFLYPDDKQENIEFDSFSGTLVDNDYYNVNYELKEGEETVEELVDFYQTEEKYEGTYWGEEALFKQILLTGQAGYINTQMELIDKFSEKYPGSNYLETVQEIKQNNNEYDYSESHKNVKINNEYYNIFVDGFRAEKDIDKSATIKIGGRSSEIVREGQKITLDRGDLIIEKIEANGVLFSFDAKEGNNDFTKFINLNSYGYGENYEIEVKDINTRQVAYVSIEPELDKQYSEAPFSFKIGIEKRNIEINPTKAKYAIESLNKSIESWEEILDNLADVIKVWKAACFATSSILMLETMLSGFSGQSIARNKIMTGYKTYCDIEISKGNYQTRTECYNAISSQIDSDVLTMTTAINAVNDDLQSVQQGNVQTQGILGTNTIINQTRYVDDLKNKLQWQGVTVDGTEVKTEDLTKATEVSSVMLYQKLGCSIDEKTCSNNPSQNIACCSAYEEMVSTLKGTAIQKKANLQGQTITNNIQTLVGGGNNPIVQNANTQGVSTLVWSGQKGGDFEKMPAGINNEDKVQFLNLNGKSYLLKLKDSVLGGSMGVEAAYYLENNKWVIVENLHSDELDKFVFIGGSKEACKLNVIKNPEVRFYESGSNKGLPAIVPFDVENGWYVYVPDSQGNTITGTQTSYTAAGDVYFFWICNVGQNGVIEQKTGDDLCQSFSASQTGFDTFISCGITGSEVAALYAKAKDAIRQASVAYQNQGYIDILGQNVRAGTPVSDTGGAECQDFMSPDDCKLLFNACDPVICPASRCDMGGKYPVSDVVQTGIIGSILLCLPNYREGIMFPVCLTGIHAGIDAFVSILKSERDCLIQNVENGEYVGICDEITAIYICEFFWRQFSSVIDAVLPTFLENLFGQRTTRGGGEYLAITSAWENLGRSMEYFTGFYAENAFTAFNLQNSENIGTEICNGFLGTSIPTSLDAEGWNALLSPESPAQFYAHFSETPYSDATSPATSHYKVYYHIYSGNDFGTSFQVYLQNPPSASYYATTPYITVKTGFVAAGQSADESIDLTAPSGYSELCVRINGEENCGFGTVSSDFLVTYASEKYIEDQATDSDITTEEECMSTSSSAWALISPNLQSGIEESIGGTDINSIGITRVCASSNPSISIASYQNTVICTSDSDCGSGYYCKKNSGSEIGNCVDSSGNIQYSAGRWVDVGYCSDQSIRCWLDISTLEDAFDAVNAVNQEIYGENATVTDYIQYSEMLGEVDENYQEARTILDEQYNRIIELNSEQLSRGDEDFEIVDIIDKLNQVIGINSQGIGTSNNKAEALALKATIYRMITEEKMREATDVTVTGSTYVSSESTVQNSESASSSTSSGSVNTNNNEEFDPAFIGIKEVNEKKYISYGSSFTSNYYIQENADRTLILRENSGGSLPTPVGEINENGLININYDYDTEIGEIKLGDLKGLYYSEEKGVYKG